MQNIYSSDIQINYAKDNARIYAIQNNTKIFYNGSSMKKILTPFPILNSEWIGRTKEKSDIVSILTQKHRLAIWGVGGIGKTALAKEIYYESQNKYDYLAWISFSQNWKESLIDAMFAEKIFSIEKTLEEKYDTLYKILCNIQGKMLVVVDNFDEFHTNDLLEILRLPADILITSRCNLSGIEKYYLKSMSEDECIEMFKKYLKYTKYTYEEEYIIREIIQKSKRHTLLLELIAKTIHCGSKNINTFWEKLQEKDYYLNELNLSVNTDWNDALVKEDIIRQLSKIFELSELSDSESAVIKILAMLPAISIVKYEDIMLWCGIEENIVTSLESKGWIQKEKDGIYIHEIVQLFVNKFNRAQFDECNNMLNDLEIKMQLDIDGDALKCLKYANYCYNIFKLTLNEEGFRCHTYLKCAALIYKEVGKYNYSREILDYLIKQYDERNQNDILILAELYNNYSKVLSMESDIEKSTKKAKKAEFLIDLYQGEYTEQYWYYKMIIKKTIAMQYCHKNNYNLAIKKMKVAIKASLYIDSSKKYQVANLYSDYALLLYSIGELIDSEQYYEKVLKLYDECNISEGSVWRNTTYTNYADVLLLNNKRAEAMFFAFKALCGKYKTYKENNLAVANALMTMGNIFIDEIKLWDVAAMFYTKAVDIYKEKYYLSDGYCNSIANLSIVTENVELANEAYEMLFNVSQKKFSIKTYVDVMRALEKFPDKVIKIGDDLINNILMKFDKHIVEPYVYALMMNAYSKMDRHDKVYEYLNIVMKKIEKSDNLYSIYAKNIVNCIKKNT